MLKQLHEKQKTLTRPYDILHKISFTDTVETYKSLRVFETSCVTIYMFLKSTIGIGKSSFFQKITCPVLHKKRLKWLKWVKRLRNAIIQNKSEF